MCEEARRLKKEGTRRQTNPLKETTLVRFKAFEEFGDMQQHLLHHRCATQEWVGVTDAKFEKYGRGLVSLQRIRKDDVIVDYHGLVVEGKTLDDHLKEHPYVNTEFCLEITQLPKRIIDASAETCVVHPGIRCLGRLANHALAKKGSAANMVLADILLDALPDHPRVVVLQARLNIEPFEQLRFDYTDKVARALFKD